MAESLNSEWRRLRPGHMPDPAKAHGAWVYLASSVLAGTLSAIGKGVLPALCVGLGFAGVCVVSSALALQPGARLRRAAVGTVFAVGAPALALGLGADPSFLRFSLVALLPVACSGYCVARRGFYSPGALGFAVAALVVAAPSAACAGGVSSLTSWLLLLLLAPFFVWRTWRLRKLIMVQRGADRAWFRRKGLREALYAVLWTGAVVGLVHGVALV